MSFNIVIYVHVVTLMCVSDREGAWVEFRSIGSPMALTIITVIRQPASQPASQPRADSFNYSVSRYQPLSPRFNPAVVCSTLIELTDPSVSQVEP